MSLKSNLAQTVGKLSKWALSTFTKGGSSLPGKLALGLDPNILSSLAENYDVAIITGTNGKTLTTSLSIHALSEAYPDILTNSSGSNMQQGIVSTFLEAPSRHNREKGLAVLEIDEGSLKHVVSHLQPIAFVHTNVFPDQLDRFGKVDTVYQLMIDAALMAPEAVIITNADLPLLNSASLPNPRLYFGFEDVLNQPLSNSDNPAKRVCPLCGNHLVYQFVTYADQGNYYCSKCHFKRPNLDYRVTAVSDLNVNDSHFEIDDHPFSIPISGVYNLYNALAAYSLSRFLGTSREEIATGFQKVTKVFGRQESVKIDDKHVLLNLVKNPVGLNQVIDLVGLEKEPLTLIAVLNNNYADGTDTDWIWEADFEIMDSYPIEAVFTAGMRKEDMTKRLAEANIFDGDIIELDSLENVIDAVKSTPSSNIHIFATYTAILELRKLFQQQEYL